MYSITSICKYKYYFKLLDIFSYQIIIIFNLIMLKNGKSINIIE
jgi:hypothetical protein